jgi:large subunit ribosomal protein L18
MPKDKNAQLLRAVRHARVRKKVHGTSDQPRLCVYRSIKSIYAQVIDDTNGHTIVAASSKDTAAAANKTTTSTEVGKLVAERAISSGIKKVVFDRGGYKYHGRVKALAEAAREGGLQF